MSGFDLLTHNTKLQSLRGLAALSVAVGHAAICVPNALVETVPVTLTNFPLLVLRLLFQANTAVIFFFVLSGLVLGSSLKRSASRSRTEQYLGFLIRRLWRLMPVAMLSVFFAAAAFTIINGQSIPPMAKWFDGYFRVPITATGLLRNAALFDANINGVLWSIQVELVMILVLPLLALVVARTSLIADLALVAALYVAPLMFLPPNIGQNFAFYVYCFYLGMMLYKLGDAKGVREFLTRGDLLVAGLGLMILAEALWLLNGFWIHYKYFVDTIVSAQILLFVMLRPDVNALRMQHIPFFKTLGDMSYSFYAFGLAITVVAFVVFFKIFNAPVALTDTYATILVCVVSAAAILVIFALSLATYRWIEIPSMSIGRRLSSLVTGR
jgi:peptidoglycan/LPS O-acetylase OafA/YrhL